MSFLRFLIFCCLSAFLSVNLSGADRCAIIDRTVDCLADFGLLTNHSGTPIDITTGAYLPVGGDGTFTNIPGAGYTWLRVCLRNEEAETYDGVLLFGNIVVAELVFYDSGPNGTLSARPAYSISGDWPFRGNLPEFPVSVPGGEERVFYLRAKLGRQTQLNILFLRERTDFARVNQRWQLTDGFIAGIGFLYLLASLIFAFINRRSFFVWSAVYAFLLWLVTLAQAGLLVHLLGWSRGANDELLVFASGASALVLPVLFLQYADFPRVQSWMRRKWYIWLSPILFSLVLIFVPGALLGLLEAAPWLRGFLRVFLFVALFLLVGLGLLLYEAIRQPTLDTFLFFLAYVGFFIPPVMMVLINNGYHFGGGGPREAFAVAMVWQIVVLSFLLYRRLRIYYRNSRETALAAEQAQRESAFRQAKNQLYSNLSHEFRTPLTIMRGLADRLQGKPEDRQLLRRHNDELLDLVNQLLELDRLDDNRLEPRFVRKDLAAQTAGIVHGFRTLADEAGVGLSFAATPTSIRMSYAERFWQRILTNLIGNALKFTPPGGTVRIELGKIDQRLILTVADTGCGMTETHQNRVFERFYQEGGSGSGIGLALVHELVTRLGGTISVVSRVDAGSTFTVDLPAVQHEQQVGGEGGDGAQDAKLVEGQRTDTRPRLRLKIDDPGLKAFVEATLQDRFNLVNNAAPIALSSTSRDSLLLQLPGEPEKTVELALPCSPDDLLLEVGLLLRYVQRQKH